MAKELAKPCLPNLLLDTLMDPLPLDICWKTIPSLWLYERKEEEMVTITLLKVCCPNLDFNPKLLGIPFPMPNLESNPKLLDIPSPMLNLKSNPKLNCQNNKNNQVLV